jgi:hypothetical protein
MKTYSIEQQNYFQAKKEYEEILKQLEIEVEKSGANNLIPKGAGRTPETKALFHKKMEIVSEIEFKLGKWESFTKLNDAENKMIEWSFNQVKVLKEYESEKEGIEHLMANYKKFPKIKEKLVETAIKLVLNKSA